MPPLPILKPKDVVGALQSAGFYIHHQRGSHARLLCHAKPEARVTIPMYNKELPPKTLRAIIHQARLTVEEFIELL